MNDAIEFAAKNICHATFVDCRTTTYLCIASKKFSHTIKQLLHHNYKILPLCNIKGELAGLLSLNIAHSQYFFGIDTKTDKYYTLITLIYVEKKFCHAIICKYSFKMCHDVMSGEL